MANDLAAERDQAMEAFTQTQNQIREHEQVLGALHRQLEQQRGILMWLESKLAPEQSAPAEPDASEET